MRPRSDLRSPLYSKNLVRWEVSHKPEAYPAAVTRMEAEALAIAAGEASELVWLLEHPALYTSGTSAKPSDLLQADRFPVFASGRGGQYTYHGPGQCVAYVMLNLKQRGEDVRAFVGGLEDWLIHTLSYLGVDGGRREDRVGVWVPTPGGGEEKIAAIGLRIKRWVSFHGISLNVDPDLDHFSSIIPCGVAEHGVTSLAKLGITADKNLILQTLRRNFELIFGPTVLENNM